ncbi:hypothetical protein [Bifidobacterium pullorum]|uniref:hypothetical protein n=1 Tax=Bifidobacterium pullorum TaxID=78448 RepID=UPI002941E6DD|nr:hypothetical protein [Bifidobacterium pullorum]
MNIIAHLHPKQQLLTAKSHHDTPKLSQIPKNQPKSNIRFGCTSAAPSYAGSWRFSLNKSIRSGLIPDTATGRSSIPPRHARFPHPVRRRMPTASDTMDA